ncbi:hypothetical protein [Myxococcus virescens]|uniref:Uncharacterized protein n=1 Tax=Myxococcus virescens TaxID=83456 RepID=A0A511HP63_9BACT|nr:hypothetical protein [Myxococcus virescens]GEL75387.1 hypothetical protein MVI01_71710 [Myxococcus virescens]SDE65709.1 hypothetical protein SAMN04488504_109301 [Myxococcus virescens]
MEAVQTDTPTIRFILEDTSEARRAYEALREAFDAQPGGPVVPMWEDLSLTARGAWRAATQERSQRVAIAEGMVGLLRKERDGLAQQVRALKDQLRLVEQVREEEAETRREQVRETKKEKSRVRELRSELDGPGGFREYQRLTVALLEKALEGLPELTADLHHPVWANRAAAAIQRLRAESSSKAPPADAVVVKEVGFAWPTDGRKGSPLFCLEVNRVPEHVEVDWSIRVASRPNVTGLITSVFDDEDVTPAFFVEWNKDFVAQVGDVLEFIPPPNDDEESAPQPTPAEVPAAA